MFVLLMAEHKGKSNKYEFVPFITVILSVLDYYSDGELLQFSLLFESLFQIFFYTFKLKSSLYQC
jgi:hypothetical protein